MSWSIAEVARHSGVTSRTLRHYDAIGLLAPAWTGHGGRRYYEHTQLMRLQRILLLRDLGLGLDVIGDILTRQDGDAAVEVLEQHRAWLVSERARIDTLIDTVDATMKSVQEGGEMAADKLFQGFDHDPHEAEARARWGDQAVDDSHARMRGWSLDQADQAKTGFDDVMAPLRTFRSDGVAVDDERVQQVIDGHHTWLNLFWTPNRESYSGLADMYVDDERFRQNIGGGDDALVEYLRDAMKVYADTRLS